MATTWCGAPGEPGLAGRPARHPGRRGRGNGTVPARGRLRGLPPRPPGATGRLRRWAHEVGPGPRRPPPCWPAWWCWWRPAGWWLAWGGAARAELARPVRRGRGARRDGPAGGARHLDRVAAGHDRRRGRAGAGHPRLAARRGTLAPRSARGPGGAAAHPGAHARGAAQVRRRPRRPKRRPDHRRADHQRPAARPRPARPARRAVPFGARRAGRAPQGERAAPVHPARGPDRGGHLGGPGPGARPVQPRLRAGLRQRDRPARAVHRGGPVRGRRDVDAGAGPVPGAGAAAGRRRIRGHAGDPRSGRGLARRRRHDQRHSSWAALAGLGLFLLGLALYPPRPRLARRLAAFDAARRGSNGHWTGGHDAAATGPRWRLGSWLARLCAEQGWQFSSLRKNLSLAGLPFEIFLATKVLLAVLGFVLGPTLGLLAGLAGFHVSGVDPGLARAAARHRLQLPARPGDQAEGRTSADGTSGTRSAPSSICSR